MEIYEVEFLCPNGESLLFEIDIEDPVDKEDREKRIKEIMKPILLNNYLELLLTVYSYEELCIFYNAGILPPREELERMVWYTDKPTYRCMSINKVPKCTGCRDGILNQYGHMDLGGCLYNE